MITLYDNSVAALGAAPAVFYRPPVLISSPSKQDGTNPAFTNCQPGDLLVAIAANSNTHSGVVPAATDSSGGTWTAWSSLAESTNRSISIIYQYATTQSHTVVWNTVNGIRQNFVFRDADIDNKILATFASSTTLDWPELTPITANSIVCTYIMSRGAQTAATAVDLGGSYTSVSTRNLTPAGIVQTSSPNFVSSFNPSNDTFDTASSGHMVAVFSVKGVTR